MIGNDNGFGDPVSRGGTNPMDDPLNMAYKQYTGRTPSGAEIATHYGNPGGLAGAFQTIKDSPEAKAFTAGQGSAAPPSPAAPQVGMPSGIDPRLAALYQKHGFTPTERGTGFGDWQYWQEEMKKNPSYDYLGRLDKDLSGTGTDQPGGGEGAGPWNRSGGGNQPPSGMMTPTPGAGIGSLMGGGPAPSFGPSLNTPNSFWSGSSPAQLGAQGQQVPQNLLGDQTSALLQQLLQRRSQPSPSGSVNRFQAKF